MNTRKRGGKRLKKHITVKTNDEKTPQTRLTVSGYVENFVTVSPDKAYLRGFANSTIKSVVRIIPEKKYPFKIIGPGTGNNKNIHYTVEAAKGPEASGYVVSVENLKKDQGRYFDTIVLRTDSKIRPLIKINVYGNILNPKPGQNK